MQLNVSETIKPQANSAFGFRCWRSAKYACHCMQTILYYWHRKYSGQCNCNTLRLSGTLIGCVFYDTVWKK